MRGMRIAECRLPNAEGMSKREEEAMKGHDGYRGCGDIADEALCNCQRTSPPSQRRRGGRAAIHEVFVAGGWIWPKNVFFLGGHEGVEARRGGEAGIGGGGVGERGHEGLGSRPRDAAGAAR